MPFLPLAREADAQVCYDQYGRPVTVPPAAAVVTPAVPPVAAVAPVYGTAGAVSATRQVARRTSRRTGRRGEVREEVWD